MNLSCVNYSHNVKSYFFQAFYSNMKIMKTNHFYSDNKLTAPINYQTIASTRKAFHIYLKTITFEPGGFL